ncbi:serine/threonine-protein kinase 19-like [Daktulosphaira vitifoliae]|uniref:serine/threonine-protein kinase 19-like n=1 Tax=Daktulosphaira vitifoliae TaxID=58002 RepID=UPI0021AAAB77|nr:serine/threonine-protein kinase 19-like [Daktulosphaira vitifoliae]
MVIFSQKNSFFIKRRKKIFSEIISLQYIMSFSEQVLLEDDSIVANTIPNDTEVAIRYIKSLLPVAVKLNLMHPPVIYVHQLYDIINNKALVKKHLDELQNKCKIQQFTVDTSDYPSAILLYEDFVAYTFKLYPENKCVKKFLNNILPTLKSFGVEKNVLRQKLKLQHHEITELINCGLLLIRNQESYWISFPSSGKFIKKFNEGRKYIIQIIKRQKFQEILEKNLEVRCSKVPKLRDFGYKYFLHDIKGSEDVKTINTTSGHLLRIS